MLKQEYKDDISLEEAIALVLKVMSKTMDSTTLGSEKCEFLSYHHVLVEDILSCPPIVEFGTLTLDSEQQPKAKIYRPAEIDALLKKHDLAKKDEDSETKS